MGRERSEVAARFGLLGRAGFNERSGFGHGLKSNLLDFRHPTIRLWSRRITLLQKFSVYLFMVLGLTMVAVGTWMNARIEDGILLLVARRLRCSSLCSRSSTGATSGSSNKEPC